MENQGPAFNLEREELVKATPGKGKGFVPPVKVKEEPLDENREELGQEQEHVPEHSEEEQGPPPSTPPPAAPPKAKRGRPKKNAPPREKPAAGEKVKGRPGRKKGDGLGKRKRKGQEVGVEGNINVNPDEVPVKQEVGEPGEESNTNAEAPGSSSHFEHAEPGTSASANLPSQAEELAGGSFATPNPKSLNNGFPKLPRKTAVRRNKGFAKPRVSRYADPDFGFGQAKYGSNPGPKHQYIDVDDIEHDEEIDLEELGEYFRNIPVFNAAFGRPSLGSGIELENALFEQKRTGAQQMNQRMNPGFPNVPFPPAWQYHAYKNAQAAAARAAAAGKTGSEGQGQAGINLQPTTNIVETQGEKGGEAAAADASHVEVGEANIEVVGEVVDKDQAQQSSVSVPQPEEM